MHCKLILNNFAFIRSVKILVLKQCKDYFFVVIFLRKDIDYIDLNWILIWEAELANVYVSLCGVSCFKERCSIFSKKKWYTCHMTCTHICAAFICKWCARVDFLKCYNSAKNRRINMRQKAEFLRFIFRRNCIHMLLS